MTCADLDELVYLPSGDAALSRRARMHSPLSAVVVRFSRARKRYERQGILVSEVALEQEALTLAVVAHIRHCYTNYYELLMSGYERREARAEIHDEVDRVLDRWRNPP